MVDWNSVIKVITGLFIVPLAVIAHTLWPWWSKQSLPVQVMTSVVVFPLTLLAHITSSWWENFN